MRTKNFFAAAVAAVVFSAAFQPAEAGPVTIDSFGDSATNTASSSSVGFNRPLQSPNQNISSVFDTRNPQTSFTQSGGIGRTAAVFSGTAVVSGGIGTFSTTKAALTSGSSHSTLALNNAITWFNQDSSTVNLLGDGVGGFNNAIKVVIPSFTQSGAYGSNTAVFYFVDTDGVSATVDWSVGGAPIGTTEIPFSSFALTGTTFNWAAVSSVWYESTVQPPNGGVDGALTNAIQFDSIQAVPEPTQMVSVAAVGAMYGAWRLRKHRRDRMTAGEATAG